MKRGPLYRPQKDQGAVFQEMNGWVVPASFSSPDHELAFLNTGVGLIDLSGWGVLRLSGDHRLDFVHRMSTNAVAELGPGQSKPTVFLTPIGRIVDLAFVFVREHDLLLFVGRGADEVVADWLRKHIFFNDDVTVEIITSQVALIGFRGPGAIALVHQLAGNGGADLAWTTKIVDAEVTMLQCGSTGKSITY